MAEVSPFSFCAWMVKPNYLLIFKTQLTSHFNLNLFVEREKKKKKMMIDAGDCIPRVQLIDCEASWGILIYLSHLIIIFHVCVQYVNYDDSLAPCLYRCARACACYSFKSWATLIFFPLLYQNDRKKVWRYTIITTRECCHFSSFINNKYLW